MLRTFKLLRGIMQKITALMNIYGTLRGDNTRNMVHTGQNNPMLLVYIGQKVELVDCHAQWINT